MIKSLYIKQFRALKELNIPLGKKVTMIVGQNATCKSTILGMIGQPFGLKEERTIFNKFFATKFSEIFKMSEKYDKPGEHEYYIEFYNSSIFGKDKEVIKSYPRSKDNASHIRLVVGKTRAQGEGNLDYPVIYLGLKRTYPIGELNKITLPIPTLSDNEIQDFNKWYNNIFYPLEAFSPIQITSKGQKDTLAINTDQYDYFANSAGQDNIGQILGSIISFQRLKNKLGTSYQGGLLLIDEFDVTLFSTAQKGLIQLFYKVSHDLNLQFVFTTHSISTIDYIMLERQKNNDDTSVIYITKKHGPIELHHNPNRNIVLSDLEVAAITDVNNDVKKINLYCEDKESRWFIRFLLETKYRKLLSFRNESFSCNFLKDLANKRLSEFRNSIFVLDGDVSGKKITNNVVILPGTVNPENLFRLHLESLDPRDPFWNRENQYTKQVFIKNLSDITNGIHDNREKMKQWFINESKKGYWGRNGKDLFQSWYKSNVGLACSFEKDFIKVFNRISSRLGIPSL